MSGKTPVRLQLSRRKGFDLQALSLATNGLPAVKVARPGKWGNPYYSGDTFIAPIILVRMFREEVMARGLMHAGKHYSKPDIADALRGKNLACFCPLDQPCHADVLLEIANG